MNQRINVDDEYALGQDKVNMADLEVDIGDTQGSFLGNKRDLVKFGFETINNNNTSLVTATHFRAYLTGYSDSHSAEWSAKRYSGRGENFYTYQGFDRDVNFNFKVAAQSRQEMRFIYRKIKLSTFNFISQLQFFWSYERQYN